MMVNKTNAPKKNKKTDVEFLKGERIERKEDVAIRYSHRFFRVEKAKLFFLFGLYL